MLGQISERVDTQELLNTRQETYWYLIHYFPRRGLLWKYLVDLHTLQRVDQLTSSPYKTTSNLCDRFFS